MSWNLQQWYTVAEVAKILGVTEKSVRDFINAGELEAVKVGKWRIARENVEAFIDARSSQMRNRARSFARQFLDERRVMEPGSTQTLVVRDYYSPEPRLHGYAMSVLMQRLPQGSNVEWRYFYDPDLHRARHIFFGNFSAICDLIVKLEENLTREDKNGS